MKKLILDNIEEFRTSEGGFNKNTMRWSKWYVEPKVGIVWIGSKKDKSKHQNAIHLCDMNRESFGALDDDILLSVYTNIVRRMSKQM